MSLAARKVLAWTGLALVVVGSWVMVRMSTSESHWSFVGLGVFLVGQVLLIAFGWRRKGDGPGRQDAS